MKKRVKNLWLKALRSGEYKQGHGQLRDENDRFCCLGVLCDLYARQMGEKWVRMAHGDYEIHDQTSMLPDQVVGWAWLESDDPELPRCPVHNSLVAQNDYAHANFSRIADLIERYL